MENSLEFSKILKTSKKFKDNYVDVLEVLCKDIKSQSNKQQKAILKNKEGEEILLINNYGESKAQNKELEIGCKYSIYRCQVKLG